MKLIEENLVFLCRVPLNDKKNHDCDAVSDDNDHDDNSNNNRGRSCSSNDNNDSHSNDGNAI